MKLLDDTEPSLIIPISDSTLGVSLESMESMTKAALYARVSTDAQQKEGTINSQIAELKKQIAEAGHELVKEYIDDGYSGAYLDRPALEELRAALKTNTFDAVYFLCADRIARDAIHQNIIVSELLKHKKRIIISGKDYEENPENKFALTVFGAVSEFERAKLIERMTRGKQHRLRMGELASQGHICYGYTYARKTDTSAPALVVNEEQAAVVRTVFEMYASGNFSIGGISCVLEERGVPAYKGGYLWDHSRISKMLKTFTYTGMKYFNTMTVVRNVSPNGTATRKGRKLVYRNRDEWIGIKVPAIVSQELFDKVQERLRAAASRYRKLPIREGADERRGLYRDEPGNRRRDRAAAAGKGGRLERLAGGRAGGRRNRERPPILRQRAGAVRGVRRFRRQASLSTRSRRADRVRSWQGRHLRVAPTSRGGTSQATVSDRG